MGDTCRTDIRHSSDTRYGKLRGNGGNYYMSEYLVSYCLGIIDEFTDKTRGAKASRFQLSYCTHMEPNFSLFRNVINFRTRSIKHHLHTKTATKRMLQLSR